ncbi:hypothetical protein HRbin36_02371 [bacterium HR36]|nr:hypothetical protein HRbin36_02371 [bacterium HR36]
MVHQFPVALRLARLLAHAPQLSLHFSLNVLQPSQVFLNTLEFPQSLLFFGFETANARRLFKEGTPFQRRSGEESIHLALLDDAISLTAQTATQKQLFNVAQACGLMIDEVFAVTIAVNASGNSYLIRVERKKSARVVERQRNLSHA